MHRLVGLLTAVAAVLGLLVAPSVANARPQAQPTAVASDPGDGPGTFTPVAPTRILDTRYRIGASTPAADKTITVSIGDSFGPVGAVAINLTVTGASAGGYLTAYATGAPRPGTSNLDFPAAKTVANLAIVPVSADGKITLYNGSAGSTPVIGDVAGYYVSGSASLPGSFSSVTPSRVLDTRSRVGASTPGANATISMQVGGRGGVPTSGVSAVAVNLTVTRAAKGGYLTAYAAGAARPVASNVNFPAGSTVATLAVVPVGSDGKINIFNGSGGSTPVIGDVAGYYRSGTAARAGTFTAVPPARVLDTRSGNGASTPGAQATIDVQVAGRGGVPAGRISAVVLNLTVTRPTRSGYVTAFADGEDRPTASNLNFGTGSTVANLAVVPVGDDGKISIYNGATGSTPVIADVAGYVRANPWQFTNLPQLDGETFSGGVSCATSTHCVAAGATGGHNPGIFPPDSAVAFTLDGGVVTAEKLPKTAAGGAPYLTAVSCTSTTDCVAVGYTSSQYNDSSVPLVETLSGGHWSASSLPAVGGSAQTQLQAVSCTTATSCIAVGHRFDSDDEVQPGLPIVEQLSGSTWTARTLDVPSGYSAAQLESISCAAAGSCVAVGTAYQDGSGYQPGNGLVERLSGSTWTPQTLSDESYLFGVSCPAGATTCEAVGKNSAGALAVTVDAQDVREQTLPSVYGRGRNSLIAVSCVAVGECTAVGLDNGGAYEDGTDTPLAQTLHAGSWSADHPPLGTLEHGYLVGVSCTSTIRCVALGSGSPSTNDSGDPLDAFLEARS
ncbi:hypothetical protein [uncultured Jatrophihabitans sp.]|uniref:hypothetical protein n=1 Tax=uncultured Jatrophihabitans sp. TaxID=1610747 RepID=UPI0035CA60B0